MRLKKMNVAKLSRLRFRLKQKQKQKLKLIK